MNDQRDLIPVYTIVVLVLIALAVLVAIMLQPGTGFAPSGR